MKTLLRHNDSEYSHGVKFGIRSAVNVAALLTLAGLLTINPIASANDCPDSWSVPRPNLVITSSPILRIDEHRGTESRSYTSSLPPSFQGMTGDTFASKNFSLFRGHNVVETLRKLGSNAEISATYISSTKSPFQNLEKGNGKQIYDDWASLFGPPETAWKLRWMGLGNGSSLTYRVSIYVKGCKEFVIESNAHTFSDLPDEEFGIDPFFELFETKSSFYRKLTFRQIESSKENLTKNISAIRESVEKVSIRLERIDSEVANVIGFLFVGLSPGGCLNVNDGGRSIPPWNAPRAELLTTPCKVGVFSMFPDKGLSGVTLVTSFDVIRSRKDETRDQAQAQAQAQADTQTQEEAKAKARADALAAAKAKAEADVVAGGGAEALSAAKAKAEAAKKRVTAICVKGRVTKKVSALNPKCPIGYKRK